MFESSANALVALCLESEIIGINPHEIASKAAIASISICLSVGLSSQKEVFQFMPELVRNVFSKNPVSF